MTLPCSEKSIAGVKMACSTARYYGKQLGTVDADFATQVLNVV